eukprot:CCRYP_020490-RA/>CCRYP_020490-RA protein AED:0.47 eAED:0.47 QI:0/-1/0/1/-1/0/1/0/40
MILAIHSDASYLSETKHTVRVGGTFSFQKTIHSLATTVPS